jgi:D-alanyl-D-alanine dipeptidase
MNRTSPDWRTSRLALTAIRRVAARMTRDNAGMVFVRWILVALLVMSSSIGCGAGVMGSASRTVSSDVIAVATSSVPATSSPSVGDVPAVSAQASAAGFVDVRSVVPNAIIDLRYATPANFVGTPLYPADARCLVHESMAPGLTAAAEALQPQGDVLVFWDCYRPHDVQVRMFDAVPNPNWVARPGPYARSHEAGRSVDVTIANTQQPCAPAQQVGGRCLVDMGTDFDDFSPRALAFATEGVSADAQSNRARLRAAMSAGGLTVYSGEWWHFDGPGAAVQRPILDVPID